MILVQVIYGKMILENIDKGLGKWDGQSKEANTDQVHLWSDYHYGRELWKEYGLTFNPPTLPSLPFLSFHPVWCSLSCLGLWFDVCHYFWKILDPIGSSSIFSAMFSLSLPFWNSNYIYTKQFDMVPQFLDSLIFFLLFFSVYFNLYNFY